MNNKGFAITTILYGTLILFLLLLVSMLGILSTYRNNLEKLVESNNGSRTIVTMKKNNSTCQSKEDVLNDEECSNEIMTRGLYCFEDNTCSYISNGELKS